MATPKASHPFNKSMEHLLPARPQDIPANTGPISCIQADDLVGKTGKQVNKDRISGKLKSKQGAREGWKWVSGSSFSLGSQEWTL
jgi:hypothetical protein